ncbi:MAG TPA: contractile injection system tape measure protein [Draconibacterium sp.]|nr:contractile injection system tape measure protein [Draconibacterium sp.]
MNEQKHIINRSVLELKVPGRVRAQLIQNKTSDIVRQKLQPALDNLFSKLTGNEEIVRIDKLEIDLGTISENDLENEFVEMAIKEVEYKVNALLRLGVNKAKLSPANGKSLNINGDFIATSKSQDFLEQFIYFLKNGHFPWWHKSSVRNGESALNANKNIFREVLNVENELLKNKIIPLLKNNRVRKRLVFQFNHSYLYELLKRLNAKLFESYSTLFQYLLSCADSSKLTKTLTDSFYEIVLEYFSIELELKSEDQKIGFIKDILDLSLAQHSDNEKDFILTQIILTSQFNYQKSGRSEKSLTIAAVVQAATDLNSPGKTLQETIQYFHEKNEPVIKKLIDRFSEKMQKMAIENIEYKKDEFSAGSSPIIQGNEQEVKTKNKNKTFSLFPPQPSTDAEQIVIYNAGLVLIHPFLKHFFEGLNLLDKELRFKSQSDAFKAIHLLQFIATGNETSPEEDLTLNKILCGLDIAEPVTKNAELSVEEKEECIYLIKTVLERWKALKTTNPSALRDTFIQREGILKQAGQSWNLTIERNTFDVMLERLPWSISFVKLPWCEQILYVEW